MEDLCVSLGSKTKGSGMVVVWPAGRRFLFCWCTRRASRAYHEGRMNGAAVVLSRWINEAVVFGYLSRWQVGRSNGDSTKILPSD